MLADPDEEREQEGEMSQLATAESVLRLLLRYLKRHQTRLSTRFKYQFLGRDVVEEILPDPGAFRSKRSWEAAMHHTRMMLRAMAISFDSGTSSSNADPEKTMLQAGIGSLKN